MTKNNCTLFCNKDPNGPRETQHLQIKSVKVGMRKMDPRDFPSAESIGSGNWWTLC